MAKRKKPSPTSILKAANAKCSWCGSKIDLQVNHVKPLSQGGTNDPSNLQILCKNCHDKYHGHFSKKTLR